MKTELMMKFSINREDRRIEILREFDAPRDVVWDAWTRRETLDRWWAPEPFRARTSHMDFREGGYWLYAMEGPEGEEHWARADFISVNRQKSFSVHDSFCDREGNINRELPQSRWDVYFSDQDDKTLVNIVITYDSLAALDQYVEMGFREGLTMGFENLDRILKG